MGKSIFAYTHQKDRTEGIAENIQKMSISAIKEMNFLATKYQNVIPLSWGLPSFPTPDYIIEGVIKALREDKNIGKYPPSNGIPELRSAIADRVKIDRNWEVDPDKNVIVTVGAMEAVSLALHTLVNPGDEVIVTDPGFASHYQQIQMVGGVAVGWKLDKENNWDLHAGELEEIITPKTKVIIMNSPCNPVGSVFSKEQLDKVAEIAKKHNVFIISDEPYDYLVFDDKKFYSIAQNESIRENLILIRSLSKEYAMTGWRIGYIATEEGLRNQMLKVHDSLVTGASRPAQVAALIAMTGPQDDVKIFQEEILRRRDIFCSLLDEQSDLFEYVKPQGAYYIFPKIKIENIDSYEFAIDLLDKVQVACVPGDAFGTQGAGHLRMTFCGSEEEIREAFRRIDRYKKEFLKM